MKYLIILIKMLRNEFKNEIKNTEGKKNDKYNFEKVELLSFTKDDECIQESLKELLKDPEIMKQYFNKYYPKFFENFELLEFRDSGGESNVYMVVPICKRQKEKTLRKVIMKVILNNSQKEKNKEYSISHKLKNQNVINNYGYSSIKKNESSMILMEDARYGSIRNFLRNILKRKTISETFICYLAYQILNSIKYIHKCNVAHMDIKLHNIVIDEYLTTKLIDFSISINYKDKKPNDSIELPCKGTNFYMSKEVLESKKIKIKDLQKVDLYAFGVLLYNLAFGCYPYGLSYGDEDNFEVILQKIKDGKLEFNDNNNKKAYSSYFLDFLTKLLEKDINKRINLKEAEKHYWIQGVNILLDEKEQYYNLEKFTCYLLTDYFKNFNDYIHN